MSTLELKKVKLEELNEEFRSLKTKISNLISEINLEEETSKFEIGIKETGYLVIIIPDIFHDEWDDLIDLYTDDEKWAEIEEQDPSFFHDEKYRSEIISYFVQLILNDKGEALRYVLDKFGGISQFELEEVKKDEIGIELFTPSHKWINDLDESDIGIGDKDVKVDIYLCSYEKDFPKSKSENGLCVYYPNELKKGGNFFENCSVHYISKSEFHGDWDDCPRARVELPVLALVYKKKV